MRLKLFFIAPTSPPFPPSPHPELVASPKSIAADVFERVAARSGSKYPRSNNSSLTSSSPFRKGGIFPRPESSLYYTASLKSFGSFTPGDQSDSGEALFGGELAGSAQASAAVPTTSGGRLGQPSPTIPSSIGVLSALLESTRGRASSSQHLARRYTEDWVRRYQRADPNAPLAQYSSPDGEGLDTDDEDEEDDGSEEDKEVDNSDHSRNRRRRRNHSNSKTITQADIANILRAPTPIPPELTTDSLATREDTSDNDTGYFYFKTAPQSMAETISSDTPPMLEPRGLSPGESITRPVSRTSTPHNGTITPTQSSYLAPVQLPSRTNSRVSVKWNGKVMIIRIPADIRDDDGIDAVHNRPRPMTKEEVFEKLREWERMGYIIEARDDDNSQSRTIYPEEDRGPIDKSKVYVSIPDRREWEAYVQALREEKLRALGVILGDEPAPLPPTNSRGQTPKIPMGITTFTPPPLAAVTTAIGNHLFNTFSPSGTPQPGFHLPAHLPSPSIPPAGFGHAFHNPRQSISFHSGITAMPAMPMSSPAPNDWESFPMLPQPPLGTPPFHAPGWNSPFGRGGSPALSQGLGSNGLNGGFNPAFVEPPLMSPVSDFMIPENALQNCAQTFAERLHLQHQSIRRGSPLAHVREVSVEESEPVLPLNKYVAPPPEPVEENQGPKIVEPVPKHQRNQPSVSLQREMQGVENVSPSLAAEKVQEDKIVENENEGANVDEFVTNPNSPVPPNYLNESSNALHFPDQPDMPNIEVDVHIGQELASNPDDDIDLEKEANERREAALNGSNNSNTNAASSNEKSQFQPHSRTGSQTYYPQSHFLNRSRGDSLSLQAQIHHDYDSNDPIQQSAMAMLVPVDMLALNDGLREEVLSEDARTNISEIETNPSVPASPRRKYSVANGANPSPWAMPEAEIPKFNSQVSAFKFDPTATFNFTPSNFEPPVPPKDTSVSTSGSKGFNVAAPAFTPGGTFNFMNNKPATFNPAVPTFTPSFATPSFPEVPFVRPSPVKKIIPIVRPPSRKGEEQEEEDDGDVDTLRAKSQEGVRKRTRHAPTLESSKETEVKEEEEGEEKEKEKPKGSSNTGEREVDTKIEVPAETKEIEPVKETEAPHQEDGEDADISQEDGGDVDDIEDVSSDEEAEELMTKAPTEVVSQDFNPYEFKTLNEMEEFANARPSTTFDKRRAKHVRTPDTPEDDSITELHTEESKYALPSSVLDAISDKMPSPPPDEDQPPPPPVSARRSSLHPGAAEFKFDFKSGVEPFASATQQPPTPNNLGMAASKYAFPSPPQSKPVAPPSILSPALSNPSSPVASQPQGDEEEEEQLEDEVKELSAGKRQIPPDSELDDIVRQITDADPPYLSRPISDRDREEEEDETDQQLVDEEEEEFDEDAVPWKARNNAPRRPPLPDFNLSFSEEPKGSAASVPVPKLVEAYRHRASSFSPDEAEVAEARTTSYRPPELPPVEKYRSTAIGITGRDSVSDWDDTVSDGINSKLRPQSRLFFDSHVEELVGALLRSHIEPIDRSLSVIQHLLTEVSSAQAALQSRRKPSYQAESDADDEDEDEPSSRPTSPRRDRKLEKIKAALIEALQATQANLKPVTKAEISASSINAGAEVKAIMDAAVNSLGNKLEANRIDVEDAMKEIQAVLEKGQSGNLRMIMPTLNRLQDSIQGFSSEREIFLKSLKPLEDRLEEVILQTRNDTSFDEFNMNLSSQLESLDAMLQATKKNFEDKVFWLNRNLNEVSTNLKDSLIEKQDTIMQLTKGLDEKFLDYSMITVENNKALEVTLCKKNDAVMECTRALAHRFDQTDSRHDAIYNETRAMTQRIIEATKSIEAKLQDRDRALHEATKNLENRLYERDMAMVMDARNFVEERLKERDATILSVTKTLNDKLQNRDISVIMDATRSLDERLQERDRAVLEATKSLEDKLQERDRTVLEATLRLEERIRDNDLSLILDATRSLDEKLNERDVAFAEATAHLEEKLQIRDDLVSGEITQALAERLAERDASLIEDTMKALEEKLEKNDKDMQETRKAIEKLINRDHESLVEVTQALEDALKQRDIAMNAQATAAFQSLEERVMERENNHELMSELRAAIEEMLNRQSHMLEAGSHQRSVGGPEAEELHKRLGVLESLLEEARTHSNYEADLRRQAQERAVELETRLRLAEEERDKQKELAEEAEQRMKVSDEQRHQALAQSQMRSALLEGAHSSLQKSVSDLSARNAMLEGALQQANATSERLGGEHTQVHNENRELRRTIETLRSEMEESIRVREGFRGKFNKLQEDMRTASAEIGKEQARWARRDEEQKARIEVLEARLAAEAKGRENLEREIERLRGEERDAVRLKVELEHVRRHGDRLEAFSDKIRAENIEQQRQIAILQVDVETARQAAREEIARANAALQRDVDAAKNETNLVKATLEKQLEQARIEVDRVTQEAEAAKLQTAALQEQQRKHNRQLEEIRTQHERSLANARQDAERDQAFLRQNLTMARNQSEHLRERVAHLEDRLSVATTAAQAAAKAAREAKTSPSREAIGSNTGEKVSPQALRESIVVLQEQLGEREARIEELQQRLSSVEKEASKKLKDSDFEIGWLRELLSERLNELEEIASALQSPSFNREVVKEAAVRLKTNLQMEQQVRERAMNSGGSDFNATPLASVASVAGGLAKQLPLAWGSWRKTKTQQEDSVQPSPSMTPSRPAATSTQPTSFLSGFLTPPTITSARSRIAGLGGSEHVSKPRARPALDMSGYATAPGSATSGGPVKRDRGGEREKERQGSIFSPEHLMRRQSYDDDADADVSVLGSMGFYGDIDGEGAGTGAADDFDVGDDVPPFKTGAFF